MTTILIVGLPSSYTHFFETLQVIKNLDKLKFDELGEMLAQHDQTFGKKKQGEDVFFKKASKSKSSTDNSRGRGHFNQHLAAHSGQGHGRSQNRGNFQGSGTSQGRGNFQNRGNFQGRGNSQGRGQSQGRGKTQSRGQSRGRGQYQGRGRDLNQIACRRCNKVGHFAEYCRTSIDKIPKFHQNTSQFAIDQDNNGLQYLSHQVKDQNQQH